MVYTQRIFWHQYDTPEKTQRLLEFWSTRRDICDEISFFTESDGGDLRYVPIDEVSRRAAHLNWVVQEAKNAGFLVAINILNTIGHTSDGGVVAPRPAWRELVGANGVTAHFCSCPADSDFLAYTREKYRLYGGAGADRFWIDDDVRLLNHRPSDWGCFCEACIADFRSSMHAPSTTREALVDEIRNNRSTRKKWVDRNADTIHSLIGACMEGLSSAGFAGEVGFMTSGTLVDCGTDLARWFDTMSPEARTAWIRPGGGFWDEETPLTMLDKIQVASSVRELVPAASAVYEVENYPYTLGQKSTTITGIETLLSHVAMRVDGVMFNLIDQAGNPLTTYESWVDRLRTWVPVWNEASSVLGASRLRGWSTPLSPAHVSQVEGTLSDEDLDPTLPSRAILHAGIPQGATEQDAIGAILDGVAARGMSDAELVRLLRRPLVMDGAAATIFHTRGLGAHIGLESITEVSEGAVEVFTSHPLNGAWSGFTRVATMNYFYQTSYALHASDGAEELSQLSDYAGTRLGSALTLTRSSSGSPVAILGHFPWLLVNSAARSHQLQQLLKHMAPAMPSVTARGGAQICCWWRQDDDRDVIVLFNPSFDSVDVMLDDLRRIVFSSGDVEASPRGDGTSVQLGGFSVCGLQL